MHFCFPKKQKQYFFIKILKHLSVELKKINENLAMGVLLIISYEVSEHTVETFSVLSVAEIAWNSLFC